MPPEACLKIEHKLAVILAKNQKLLTLLGLIALAVAYAYNVNRFFFISDDAFISFRYAQNLAEGFGLVWNPGERVEGYTNFLWVLIMSLGMLIGISPEFFSNFLGIVFGLILLSGLFIFARSRQLTTTLSLLLLLTLCLSRSFTAWCSSGLETMFFTTLVALATFRFIKERDLEKPILISPFIFALAALTRPEGALFAAIAGSFYLIDVLKKNRSIAQLIGWSIPLVITVGGHFVFRYFYYGYPLPNTFYAKVAGAWLDQGTTYLSLFHQDYQIGYFLPLAALSLLVRPSISKVYLAANLLAYTAYVLTVGGDRFEFRFLVVIFPFLYFMIVDGISILASKETSLIKSFAGLASIALITTTVLGSNSPVPKKEFGIASIRGIRNYADDRIWEGKTIRSFVEKGAISPDTVIAVGGAGALPYYSKLPTIDRRGLNDTFVARLPIEKRGIIAHERDAPMSYLRKRKVIIFDVLNQLVHKKMKPKFLKRAQVHDDEKLEMRAYELDGRFLIFATLVDDNLLSEKLVGLSPVKL